MCMSGGYLSIINWPGPASLLGVEQGEMLGEGRARTPVVTSGSLDGWRSSRPGTGLEE